MTDLADYVIVSRAPTEEMIEAANCALAAWRKTLDRDEVMARSYVGRDRKFVASATPDEKAAIRYAAMISASPQSHGLVMVSRDTVEAMVQILSAVQKISHTYVVDGWKLADVEAELSANLIGLRRAPSATKWGE